MTGEQKASLSDVLNYEADEYFSKDEMDLIVRTFKGNNALLNILRKVLMPMVSDPALPIEEFAKDVFIIDKEWDKIPMAERPTIMLARQDALKFIFGGLIKLKVMANVDEETEAEKNARQGKDSTK